MNCVQLMRRARQGVDAILPGGYASAQWVDEEVLDLLNEAYESMLREFRLTHRKWGLTTLNTSSAAFTRDGETYTPSTALVHGSASSIVTLPPDFAELVRILCTNNRSVRYMSAEHQTDHWIDLEQSSFDDVTSTPLTGDPPGLVFYYDILGNRALKLTPPVTGSFSLEIDYIPMFRPLLYSNAGTVTITNGLTTIAGSGTAFTTDNIYTAASGQLAEIMVGVANPQSNQLQVTRDYPRVATITSNTAAALGSAWAPATVTSVPYIIAMSPVFPREYHRWLARLTSSLMLSKVNPDTAEKYFSKFLMQFKEQINPSIRRRTSQSSPIVEDSEEFGIY